MRYCLDACRLVHFLRGLDCHPAPLKLQIQRSAGIIRKTWGDIVGATNLDDAEWTQSNLPMRLTGMGIKDPTVVMPAARAAASLTFLRRSKDLDLPVQCTGLPHDWDETVADLQAALDIHADPMTDWVRGFQVSDVCDEHLSQKWWSHRIHRQRHDQLLRGVSLRDCSRLKLQKNAPHDGMDGGDA